MLGIDAQLEIENNLDTQWESNIETIIQKEIEYMKYNDEVIDFNIFSGLSNLKKYDII